MRKKAYLRTLEMAVAALLTFIFVSYVIPKAPTVPEEKKAQIVSVLAQNDDFKNCIVSDNFDCIEKMLDEFMPEQYEFVYDLSESPFTIRAGLPKKRIFVDSFFFSGNSSVYKPRMIKVYYWRKEE